MIWAAHVAGDSYFRQRARTVIDEQIRGRQIRRSPSLSKKGFIGHLGGMQESHGFDSRLAVHPGGMSESSFVSPRRAFVGKEPDVSSGAGSRSAAETPGKFETKRCIPPGCDPHSAPFRWSALRCDHRLLRNNVQCGRISPKSARGASDQPQPISAKSAHTSGSLFLSDTGPPQADETTF